MNRSDWNRWLIVVLYSISMAWVEAAVVFYLRTHIDRIIPYQSNPLPVVGGFAPVELCRELATLIMLFTVGWLAGRDWRTRFGYMVIIFGFWDIFYYVFLKIMTGWPDSLANWDILFLLPLPWWGPVWAPMSIALLMLLWGTFVTQFESVAPSFRSHWKSFALGGAGGALALYVFMTDAVRTVREGEMALRNLLPDWFNWPLFCLALALMAVPVASAAGQALRFGPSR